MKLRKFSSKRVRGIFDRGAKKRRAKRKKRQCHKKHKKIEPESSKKKIIIPRIKSQIIKNQ